MMILEKSIEKNLKNKVEQLGGKCLKWICPQVSGAPDRLVLYKGKVYFVELKRDAKSNITILQVLFGKWLINNGFDYSILMSNYDVEHFIERITK